MNTIIIEKMENAYTIEKGKYDQEFDLLKWVMKARSLDKTREVISGVFVDDGVIVATDGHRLHMIYSELDIESGNYTIVNSNAKQIILQKNDLQFPEYWRVFPKWQPTKQVYCNGDDNSLLRAVYHDFADDVSYNTAFLHDVYMDNSHVSIFKEENPYTPLCLYDNSRRAALIMPLKID